MRSGVNSRDGGHQWPEKKIPIAAFSRRPRWDAPDEGIRLRGPMVGEELGELLRCGLEEPHDHLAAVAREHGSQRWRLLQDGQHLLDQAARDRQEDVLHRGQVTRQDLARHVRISGWGQGQGQG